MEQKVLVTYRDECFRRWLHVCALSHERKKRSAGSQNPRKSRSAALELCHEILFEEPNHTRSHPRGLIGHDRQRKPRRRGRKGMNERSRGQSVRRSVTRSFVARETWLCTGILFEEPNPELVITRPRRSDSQKGGERRWFVWHGIFIIRKTATQHKQTRRGWEPARVLLEREKQKAETMTFFPPMPVAISTSPPKRGRGPERSGGTERLTCCARPRTLGQAVTSTCQSTPFFQIVAKHIPATIRSFDFPCSAGSTLCNCNLSGANLCGCSALCRVPTS